MPRHLVLLPLLLITALSHAADNPSNFATHFLNETFRGSPEQALNAIDLTSYKAALKQQGINTTDNEAKKALIAVLTELQTTVKAAGLKSITIGEPSYNNEKTEAIVPFTIETDNTLDNLTNTDSQIILQSNGDSWQVAYPIETEKPPQQ